MAAHSKNRVKNAGEVLRRLESATPDEMLEAIGVIDEWRAGHAKPLRRVNAGLRHYVRKVGVEQPEVTQRLKRFATIADKLRRQPTMALSRMEDIGGARVTRRLGEGLKFGAGPDDLREYYVLVSELLAMRERHEQPDSVFMEQLASRFAATRRHFPNEEPR